MPFRLGNCNLPPGGGEGHALEAATLQEQVALSLYAVSQISPREVGDPAAPYESHFLVVDPFSYSNTLEAEINAKNFYSRLIEDYAFQNSWREACLGREDECYPERMTAQGILYEIWTGVPREIGEFAAQARSCAERIRAQDIARGAIQGGYAAGVRTTVIDVVRGSTRGLAGLASAVARGSAAGAVRGAYTAAQRVCQQAQ